MWLHASPGGSCLFAIFVVLERPGVDATRPSPRTSPGFPRRRCSPDPRTRVRAL